MELVSLIIPVYNAEKYLTKCIDSCISQTYQNIEIILADDGSLDHSGQICTEYASKDRRVKVCRQKNAGVSSARNLGLDLSKGRYIMFVDADDWICQTAVEDMMRAQQKSGADLIVAGIQTYDSLGNQITERVTLTERMFKNENIVIPVFRWKENFLYRNCWGKLYKRSIIRENGIHFDPAMTYGEDTCFVLDYLGCSKSIRQISARLYHYREVQDQKKSVRYGLENVDYQWKNGLILYQSRMRLLYKTGTFYRFHNEADALYLERIRFFMNICVANRCPGGSIIMKLKSVPEEKPDLDKIKLRNVRHPADKVILLLLKRHNYVLLYEFFKWKVKIYNGIYKHIKTIGKGKRG